MQEFVPCKQKRKYKGLKYSYTYILYKYYFFYLFYTGFLSFNKISFKLVNFLYLCFLLIDTGDNCHKIAAEHDRLPPSISAASKDKKGKLSNFFVLNFYAFLRRTSYNISRAAVLEQENEWELA